ncbi:putative ribonuclease H-like domain-containing protein [Tanacetum coccineum]
MDVKSAFLYGKIEEEVYVCQPPGFEDPDFPDRVYKVEKALYGLHQAPRAWYETLSTYLLDNRFQRGKIDKTLFIRRVKSDILLVEVYMYDIIFGSTKKSLCIEFEKIMHKKFQMSSMGELTFFLRLQVKQKNNGIFISQDKYMTNILKKFGFSDVKTSSTPMETHKPLLKDADGEDVDEHLYRSMIGSLMYLTSSRPDIMFAYPKDSPFDLVAYTDSDYAGASLYRKSTIKGCQFLGCRLISWQCKKHIVVANSTTEAEYIAASNCCGQVLWIQNKLLHYAYNFMQTKIHIDNESTICIVKSPVFHSKTKHIEIRHHFIRDSNEKKLIQMIKIHTDKNVVHFLTKVFDVSRFQYLIVGIGMLNLESLDYENGEKVIGGNAGDSKLMLLGINLLLLGKVNAARHNLLLLVVKTVNGEVQLQALVDGKKIIITESTIRRDLQLEDAEGIDCLPNAAIFEQLTLMGAKTTAWNEFSSTMASIIICLATNQKFNFSKYIFDSMVKNVDNVNKFLMYPRFVQMFMNQQAGDMSNHKRIYVTPSHTKKVFGNMKREGKGFSGRVTPLFPTMMVQAQQEQGEGSANPTDPQHTPTIAQPSSSQPQKKHKPRKPKKKDTQIPQSSVPSDNIAEEAINEENVPTHSNDPLLSGEDRLKLEELMALCTNLQNRVLDLEHTKTTQALEIDSLKRRVKKLEKKQRSRTHGLRRLYKVGLSARVISSEDEGLGEEDASKQGRKIHDIDADEDITLENVHDEDMFDTVATASEVVTTANVEVSTASPISATITTVELTLAQTLLQAEEQEEVTIEEKSKLFQQLLEKRRKHFAAKREEERRNRPPTKAQQRSIMCTYLKNMAGWKPKDLKTKSFANVQELFDKAMKKVNTFVDMDIELVGGSEVRAEGNEKVEAKVDDAKEAEKIKQCLEVVLDDGDDVTIDATPLSVKIPIVDYKIYQEGKKIFFKIIKADGKTQMYLTFTKMLKNFDREVLEVL